MFKITIKISVNVDSHVDYIFSKYSDCIAKFKSLDRSIEKKSMP